MTQAKIQEQLTIIRNATDKATKSKESANKFLQDAGIKKVKIATKK